MAKGQSTIDINVSATEDPLAAQWRKIMEGDKAFTIRIAGDTSRASTGPISGGVSTPGSAAYNAFDYRIRKEQYDFYRRENIAARTIGGATRGVGGGLYSFASGGGIGGLVSPIVREIQRAAQSKSGGFISGAIAGGTLARAARTARSAEVAGAGSGTAEAVAGGAVGRLLWGAMPLPVKIVSVAATAIGGAAIALDAMSRDVYGRGRTAGGVGASLGGFTAFDIAARRYVEPKGFMGMMAQAKFDITSPAFQALSMLGIDPRQYKDTSDMARAALPLIQKRLQGFKGNEGAMLPIARAMGLGGMNPDDLIRLFSGKPEDLQKLMGTAGDQKEVLGLTDDQIKAYQDLTTNIDLASTALKTWTERMSASAIPSFETIQAIIKREEGLDGAPEPYVPRTYKHPWDKPIEIPGGITGGAPLSIRRRGRTILKSPKNNPPLESSIYGGAAVGENDSPGVMGGFTRVGIFTPKIEKLNKQVIDTTKSLELFNQKLIDSSRSGAYIAARAGASIGAAGGPVATIGPGGVAISAAGIYGAGGGFAGGAGGAPASIRSRETYGTGTARPAKGALKGNQQEAYKAAIASGLSDSSARALVANMSGEALNDPGNVHWCQWRAESPHLWRSKIPQVGGCGDQPVR